MVPRDVTPTFHPAATRDRPVLSRMSAGEATGGFKPARCFSSSAANASACPARCNATRCRYRQTRQAPRSTSVPSPLRQAQDRIVADDHLQAPALGDQIAQLADHPPARDRCVDHHAQALPRYVVDNVEHPEPASGGKLAQPRPQVAIIRPARAIPHARAIRPDNSTRPPLAHPQSRLEMRDRFALRGGRYHFLTADPSDPPLPRPAHDLFDERPTPARLTVAAWISSRRKHPSYWSRSAAVSSAGLMTVPPDRDANLPQ